jgi:hypothetical protein
MTVFRLDMTVFKFDDKKPGLLTMKQLKQYKKLQRLNVKAELCESREEAQRLIQKANKVQEKLSLKRLWTNLQERIGKK